MRDNEWTTGDQASTTIAVLGIAAALLLAGLVVAQPWNDETEREETVQPQTKAESDEPTASQPAVERVQAVDWNGHLATRACVPTNPTACSGAEVGYTNERYELPVEGNLSSGEITLHWNATTPDTQRLALSLETTSNEDCGPGCREWTYGVYGRAEGTSPLTLSVEDVEIGENGTLAIVVEAAPDTPHPLPAKAHTSQSFHTAGQLVFAEP